MSDVKILEENGFFFLSKGDKYEYYCIDKLGYKYKINIRNFKKGSFPYKFHKGNKYTIFNIDLYLKLNNLWRYELITRVYKNNNTNMLWRVWKDSKYLYFNATWGNFSRGNIPSIERSWGDVHRTPTAEIKKLLDEFLKINNLAGWGYDIKSVYRYKNKHSYITFNHIDGYTYPLTVANIANKNSIPLLNVNHQVISTKNMYLLVKNNSKYLMKGCQDYIGEDGMYTFICGDHGEFENKIYPILQGATCPICLYQSRIGENHHNYNHDLTDEERWGRREYPEYRDWRVEVYKRDNYTCQCCRDSKGGNLVAHHKDGYNWCKEKRTDVSNGVTLCEACHSEFHSLYGYGENTEAQFHKFINNKLTIKG